LDSQVVCNTFGTTWTLLMVASMASIMPLMIVFFFAQRYTLFKEAFSLG